MIPSLPKFLGLLAILWLVWTTFRFFEMRQKNRGSHSSDLDKNESSNSSGISENEADSVSVDLQECDICGAWFSGKTCERKSCQK